jgi:hypothetical protein
MLDLREAHHGHEPVSDAFLVLDRRRSDQATHAEADLEWAVNHTVLRQDLLAVGRVPDVAEPLAQPADRHREAILEAGDRTNPEGGD